MRIIKNHPLLTALAKRLDITEDTILVTTAVLVGVGTGLGSIVVSWLIDSVEWIGFTLVPQLLAGLGEAYVVIVPAVGGLIVGILVFKYAREAKGHGVPEVMEAIALRGGRIRPIVAVIKSLASAITIGSGGSAGREGPMVQIGAALGSTLGQRMKLSDDRVRNLVACGAAGGIAATFNAPIAGVIFALEVILGEFSVRYFSSVVLSAVVASVIGRAVFGNIPAFPLEVEYGVNSVLEFLFYPALGILAALVGVAFVRTLYASEDLFDGWKGVPEWVKPAIGGALLGLVALVYPRVTGFQWDEIPHIFGVGYDLIQGALHSELLLPLVLALMVLKLIATSLTLGSGGSGGVFAPALFMGAMLGTAFEILLQGIFPDIPAPAGAYALVGMAAVFAASAHAPITAIMILTELTDDHRIILPLMLTVIVATLVSRVLLNKQSIYTLKLTRRGINLQRGRDVDVLQGVLVGEAMTSKVHTVTASMTLEELSDTFNYTHHHGFPILDESGALWGIVTVSDLDRAISEKIPLDSDVCQIGTPRDKLLVSWPDESIGHALQRLGKRGLGRMPVVDREDPNKLLGMIRRGDLITAYNLALTRRTKIVNQTDHAMMQSPEGTEFVELTLSENDPAVGKQLQEIAPALPRECILISIEREGKVLIPHGQTTFQQGDHVTAFLRSDDAEGFYATLLNQNTTPSIQ